MALTTRHFEDPRERLNETLMHVIESGYGEKQEQARIYAELREAALTRIQARDQEGLFVYERIVRKSEAKNLDWFACAVHLSELEGKEGSCPICQKSYTVVDEGNSFEEILSDFPVHIKYCNHIFGKACLEKWMETPKIDGSPNLKHTCPTCRVDLESRRLPRLPDGLRRHVIKTNPHAQETVKELLHGHELDTDDCLFSVLACMSDEIAIEQVQGLIAEETLKTGERFLDGDLIMAGKLEDIRLEKGFWGFKKGDAVWKAMREKWMKSPEALERKRHAPEV